MYTNSIKEQSIDSLMMIKSCCIFIKKIQTIFAFVFLTSNYIITYGWNGSAPKSSPKAKASGKQKKRFQRALPVQQGAEGRVSLVFGCERH